MPYHYGIDLNPYNIWIHGRAFDSMATAIDRLYATPPFSKRPEPSIAPPKKYSVPGIKSTITNGDATIILWEDGVKTVVRKEKDKPNDPYAAFCAAVCKRLFGSTDKVMRIMRETDTFEKAKAKFEASAARKEANRLAAEDAKKKAAERRAKEDKELERSLLDYERMMRRIRKLADEMDKVPFWDGKDGEHDTNS